MTRRRLIGGTAIVIGDVSTGTARARLRAGVARGLGNNLDIDSRRVEADRGHHRDHWSADTPATTRGCWVPLASNPS